MPGRFDALLQVLAVLTNPIKFMPGWVSKLVKVLAGVAVVVGLLVVAAFLMYCFGFEPHIRDAEDARNEMITVRRDSAAAARSGPARVAADSLVSGGPP